MEYQIFADNRDQTASLKDGRLQRSFVDVNIKGNNIRVAENTQFKKELEQDIASHFIFMLRTLFFSEAYEEITTFVNQYEDQVNIANSTYEKWQHIDELMILAKQDIHWAENKLKDIQYDTQGEYNKKHSDFMKFITDKDLMRDTLLAEAENCKRARIEAEANITKQEAEIYLLWLEQQKMRQNSFIATLDQISNKQNEDFQTFQNGQAFVDKVQNKQLQLFVERGWNCGTWQEELQSQIQIALAFFKRLYAQYLISFKFQLDIEELYELVLNNKYIKDTIIEIAQREAEKPTLDVFIEHYQFEYEHAELKLQNLALHDLLQRIRKQVAIQNRFRMELVNQQRQLNNINLWPYAQVDNLEVVQEIPNIVEPYQVEDNQKTLKQQEIVLQIKSTLDWLFEECAKLERCKQYLQELYAQPDQIRQKYAQIYQQEILGGQNLLVQIKQLLDLSQKSDFNELQFKKERMSCLVGALSDRLVIKRDTSCMCRSGQKMHVADSIFYTDYEKSIASEFRRLTNAQNKWNITPRQRIQLTDNLPSVKTTSFLMSNNSILSSLRTDDGQRQVSNGVRNFNVNRSIVFTINELCQLIVVEQKLKMNMKSPTIDQKISRWQKLQLDAQSGGKAHNRIELK